MNAFEGLILNIILISFPSLLYIIYTAYRKNIGKEEKNLFLDFALLSSLYLILKFGFSILGSISIITFNVIIVIAYLKNRTLVGILGSIYAVCHYSYFFNFNIFILLIEYIIYFIIYILKCKSKIKYSYFIILFILFKSLFLVINVILFSPIDLRDLPLKLLFTLVTFYSITYLSIALFNISEDIISYHLTIKALEQEKQIRMSLFKITHEIKNPMAVCKGYLDMFDVNNLEHSRKYILILKEEIDRTLILLQDFLSFTKVKIDKDIMDINVLLEELSFNFAPMLREKNINFNLDISGDEIFIEGDYNRLMQVMINLLKNSIESIPENKIGEIKITSFLEDKFVKIIINDNGIGISSEDLEKLKEPFFTTKPKGTGLGVSLSREIIKAHDGNIKYVSKENIGTKVEIKLKVIEEF